MADFNVQGSIVALVTPMLDNGDVAWETLNQLVDWHIAQGTDAIVAVGTTGESATLDVDEHSAVIEAIIKRANKQIPIIAGTGANSTREAIALSATAKALGAQATLLVTPYYNKPTQEGLYQHYKAIAEAVALPHILYNVPGRTGVDMSNDTVVRLASIANIVAVKDATGDLARGKDLLHKLGGKIAVYSGDDATAAEYILMGAKGNISVTANVMPALMHEMCSAALADDAIIARGISAQLAELNAHLFCESNPIPVKYALARMGKIANVLRLPLTPLAPAFAPIVDDALKRVGLAI